jgi:hypothetical protein
MNVFYSQIELYGIKIEARVSDGFVNATQLCQAGNKEFYSWSRRKHSKEFIVLLEQKVNPQIGGDTTLPTRRCDSPTLDLRLRDSAGTQSKDLIQYQSGSNEERATFVHPDIAINIAQWISPEFSLEVSRWIRELLVAGNVTLGSERTDEEIENLRKEMLEKDKIIQWQSDRCIIAEDELKVRTNELTSLKLKHNNLRQRRVVYKFKKGPCFYIVSDMNVNNRFKVGFSTKLTVRFSSLGTAIPFLRVEFVVFIGDPKWVERGILQRFAKNRNPVNHEFVDLTIEELIGFTRGLVKQFEHSELTEDELEEFNASIKYSHEQQESKENEAPSHQRCPGLTHKTEEERVLPISRFSKNKTNKYGYARMCKECISTKKDGPDRNRREIIDLPEFNGVTHKFCRLCKQVRSRDTDFYNQVTSADGLMSNCKFCKAKQKLERNEKLKNNKIMEKKCSKCKDTRTIDNYGTSKNTSDGFKAWCEPCLVKYK